MVKFKGKKQGEMRNFYCRKVLHIPGTVVKLISAELIP